MFSHKSMLGVSSAIPWGHLGTEMASPCWKRWLCICGSCYSNVPEHHKDWKPREQAPCPFSGEDWVFLLFLLVVGEDLRATWTNRSHNTALRRRLSFGGCPGARWGGGSWSPPPSPPKRNIIIIKKKTNTRIVLALGHFALWWASAGCSSERSLFLLVLRFV